MKICSVCQRCYEDYSTDCQENHESLVPARQGSPRIAGNYRLDRFSGGDAAGDTYIATRFGFERSIVIKIFDINSITSEVYEIIQKETCSFANLNHPNLVRVYETGLTNADEFYLVTEAVSYQTLREYLVEEGSLSLKEAIEIAEQTAQALITAHLAGIIHRAVSPSSIILAKNGQNLLVKLQNFDFGGIRQQLVTDCDKIGQSNDAFRYFAPEQYAANSTDPRTDVFSLGVVLYEMIYGCLPFDALTTAAIDDWYIKEQSPEKLGFETWALINPVVIQLLQKNLELRPTNASNFMRQLRHIKLILGMLREASQLIPQT
jgi:serine/threonine-protein kinase